MATFDTKARAVVDVAYVNIMYRALYGAVSSITENSSDMKHSKHALSQS